MNQSNQKAHAIVIGASMGGLLAARALADHFERVSIIERDPLPSGAYHRKSVPQSRHTHVLHARGREVLEGLFPGLVHSLITNGAATADATGDGVLFYGGGYMPKFQSGLRSLMLSRPVLETAVRERVLALPNVRLIDNAAVLGVFVSDDHTTVKGIRLQRREIHNTFSIGRNPKTQVTGVRMIRRQYDSAEETMTADLVVDAGGRGSRALAWLERMGYAPPRVETVRVDIGYASRVYRRRPDMPKFVTITPARGNARFGVLASQEDDTFVVSMGGYFGDHAPTDEQGFLEFARGLPAPDIHELIKCAEPLDLAVPAKFPASVRRRFDQMNRFPEGFVVFGDALCSFNPIYGQGMTVAALEALALGACVAEGLSGVAMRFFKRAAKIIDTPWRTAVNNDLRNPRTQGVRTPMGRFVNWYVGKLHTAARRDPQLVLAFRKVTNMIVPPASLLKPSVAWRVLKGNLRPPKADESKRSVATTFARG